MVPLVPPGHTTSALRSPAMLSLLKKSDSRTNSYAGKSLEAGDSDSWSDYRSKMMLKTDQTASPYKKAARPRSKSTPVTPSATGLLSSKPGFETPQLETLHEDDFDSNEEDYDNKDASTQDTFDESLPKFKMPRDSRLRKALSDRAKALFVSGIVATSTSKFADLKRRKMSCPATPNIKNQQPPRLLRRGASLGSVLATGGATVGRKKLKSPESDEDPADDYTLLLSAIASEKSFRRRGIRLTSGFLPEEKSMTVETPASTASFNDSVQTIATPYDASVRDKPNDQSDLSNVAADNAEAQPEEGETELKELWQYQKMVKGKRLWKTFETERSKTLTQARQSGQERVMLDDHWEVDLVKMKQRCKRHSWKRSTRAVRFSDQSPKIWEHGNDAHFRHKETWTAYSPEHCLLLTKALMSGVRSVILPDEGRFWKVNLEKMSHKSQSPPRKREKVRWRCVSKLEKADSEEKDASDCMHILKALTSNAEQWKQFVVEFLFGGATGLQFIQTLIKGHRNVIITRGKAAEVAYVLLSADLYTDFDCVMDCQGAACWPRRSFTLGSRQPLYGDTELLNEAYTVGTILREQCPTGFGKDEFFAHVMKSQSWDTLFQTTDATPPAQVVYIDDTLETTLLPESVQVVRLRENGEGVTSEDGLSRLLASGVDFKLLSEHDVAFWDFDCTLTRTHYYKTMYMDKYAQWKRKWGGKLSKWWETPQSF